MIRRGIPLLAVALASLLPGRAVAQFNNPSFNQQPGIYPNLNPSLNILRGNAAVNWYGATRGAIPSYQQNYLNNQFGTSLFDLQRRQQQANVPPEEIALLPGTGHPTAFGYYGPYYNLSPGQRIGPQQAPQSYTGPRRTSKQ